MRRQKIKMKPRKYTIKCIGIKIKGQKGKHLLSSSVVPPSYFLRQGLSLILQLTDSARWAHQKAPGMFFFPSSQD